MNIVANRVSGPARSAGFSLVELMVGLLVGLLLMAGIIQLFVSNKQAYRIQEGTSVANENARYAVDQIHRHLRMADHWGGVPPERVTIDAGVPALTGDCTGDDALLGVVGVIGFDGAGSSPLDCVAASNYIPNTDAVVIRYAVPELPYTTTGNRQRAGHSSQLTANQLYVRSAVGRRALIFQQGDDLSAHPDLDDDATVDPSAGDRPAKDIANYGYDAVAYFLRPCASTDRGTADVCDGADDDTPTLARLRIDGTTVVEEDVVAGVEQMQMMYGVDLDGDLTADRYDNAAQVTLNNDWPAVVNVRISLVVRNEALDVSYSDGATYTLVGGTTYTPAAAVRSFRRELYNIVVQIRNQTRV